MLVGVGALGTPLAILLRSLGFRRFLLVDPKKHKKSGIRTQCQPGDVGIAKVHALSRRLLDLGAEAAVPLASAVEDIEPGWAGPDAVVVSTCDRLSGTRAASDLALAMRLPFFRLQVEPAYEYATLSSFDYRQSTVSCCVTCGWSDDDFLAQEQVHSCAPGAERPTGSPRALSSFAAGWGALTLARALAPDLPQDSAPWNQQLSFTPMCQEVVTSALPRLASCECQRQRPALVRLASQPVDVSFMDLLERSGCLAKRCWLRGSGELARRARCQGCGTEVPGHWWVRGDGPCGRCATCQGDLHAIPRLTLASFRANEITAHLDAPLASFGVPPRATVTITENERSVTFVLGDRATTQRRNKERTLRS